jgi:glycosyltransferase involved in cell wall biosynthesis
MYEPFGNVHLEALASGLPVITTRLSGASEIIRDGLQGFIIDKPEDIEKIAEKILFLMDRDENQRMSSEARKLAEHFSFSAYTDKMIKLYQDVLRSS